MCLQFICFADVVQACRWQSSIFYLLSATRLTFYNANVICALMDQRIRLWT